MSCSLRPDGGKRLDFASKPFAMDLHLQPESYTNGSVAQLFYMNNIMHDIFYLRGFDEESGNFQETNFGRGGLGDDAVQANAQDGGGYNNTNFATPPDGQRPRMRMYLWETAVPKRDGDLDNGIVIHEYGHGISNRLTGGSADSGCLPNGQSGGMGEGWSDIFAIILRQQPQNIRNDIWPMGDWAAGKGIRPYPYCAAADTSINPAKFSDVNEYYPAVHSIGFVWASILWEVGPPVHPSVRPCACSSGLGSD